MTLQLYDFSLILGILFALGLFYIEIKALTGGTKSSNDNLKFIAIFGILFLLTAIICGSAITGYVTKNTMDEGLISVTQKVGRSNHDIVAFKNALFDLKKSVSKPTAPPHFGDRDYLLDQITNLEKQLDRLLDDNEDLEDDIDDLKDEIKDLYAIIPGGHY